MCNAKVKYIIRPQINNQYNIGVDVELYISRPFWNFYYEKVIYMDFDKKCIGIRKHGQVVNSKYRVYFSPDSTQCKKKLDIFKPGESYRRFIFKNKEEATDFIKYTSFILKRMVEKL